MPDGPLETATAAAAGSSADVENATYVPWLGDGGWLSYNDLWVSLACLGGLGLVVLYRRLSIAAAMRRAKRESAEMQKNPRTFSAEECAARKIARAAAAPMHRRRRCTAAAAPPPLTAAAPLTAHPPAAYRRLLVYTGRDISRPLLLAIKGRVLDVAEGEDYYGPEGPYKIMAGRDASKAFAMMSLKEEDAHSDLSGVPDEHLKILDDWYDKLTKKYPTVGRVHFVPGGGTAKREEPADMWDSF